MLSLSSTAIHVAVAGEGERPAECSRCGAGVNTALPGETGSNLPGPAHSRADQEQGTGQQQEGGEKCVTPYYISGWFGLLGMRYGNGTGIKFISLTR